MTGGPRASWDPRRPSSHAVPARIAERRGDLRAALTAWIALAVGLAQGLAAPVAAQNHPELEWRVLPTEHFRILYHDGLERTAAHAADIVEAAWGPVTSLYDYEPDGPVRLILKDYDDYANGAAYFYHDAIEIWTSPLEHDYELRGTSDWLRNVITHEFVHIVSLGAARKGSQRVPAWFVEYFGYKDETDRDDILTGAPDRLVVAPFANTVVPMWFAEGVAQHQTATVRHDRWDSHRDMILRTAVLDGSLLPLEEMGVFGKRGFGNEFVYDHGYGFVRYLAEAYGDSALAQICREASRWPTMNVNGALRRVTGREAAQLWQDWRDDMAARYARQVESVGDLREGERLTERGFSNTRPALSPDGTRVAYLSTGGRHYGPHALVVRDLQPGEEEAEEDAEEAIAAGVESVPAWDPDGDRLLFVRKRGADKYGSRRADLYEHDLAADERGWLGQAAWALPALAGAHYPEDPRQRRLTRGRRALYPAVSPDGTTIAFVRGGADGATLSLADRDGGHLRDVLRFEDRTQLYTPRWSPDGARLVLSYARDGARDIGVVDLDGAAGIRPLVTTPGTDRDPVWSADGGEVLFVSDVTGIFNVYALDVASGAVEQVTNVLGGAFFPTVGADGTVIYAGYSGDGFHLYRIDRDAGQPVSGSLAAAPAARSPGAAPTRGFAAAPGPPVAPRAAAPAAPAGQPYGMEVLRTTVMPRLSFDEGHWKAGTYVGTQDALDKQSIFGAAAYAPGNGDRDLYAVYRFRGFRPTWRLSFIHMKRHSTRGDSTEARDAIVTGMNFSLNRLSLGVGGRLNRLTSIDVSLAYDRYDASLDLDVFQPRTDGRPGFERVAAKPIGYTYLNGFDLAVTYRHDSVARRQDRDINPRGGRRVYLRYDRMFNWFIEGFDEQNTSFLQEEYLDLFYNQVTVDWREFIGLPANSTLGVRLHGGFIDSDVVDAEEVGDFFDFHLGGIPYMRGYTYYSLEGRKAAMANVTLRAPLWPSIQRRLGPLWFERAYGAVYADVGKAWDGDIADPDPVLGRKGPVRDAGVQLRLDAISFYSLPTRVELDAAYGFDEVDGKGPWKLYLTVLFNYINWIDPGE